ncbi:hypothetical protein EVAR_39522_1 [Eumeta japonica]|uniref:Uncharacterized protein n=1 Tax=Eumeta variegata TaxID=151549 RepID=A0A4C1XJA9_EUMVA|nr:hypothetical protein EVAR_39522_1 [Eumeta japonica]
MIFTLREGERNAEIPYSTFFSNDLEQVPVTQFISFTSFNDDRRMTEYVEHPCSPSTPHAPQTPILRTKESSAYIRTAPTPWLLSWCSALDQ